MKTVILILISSFCFAKTIQSDSASMAKLAGELKEKNKRLEMLIEKADKAEKRNESAFFRLKMFVNSLVKSKLETNEKKPIKINDEAVKEENVTEPVTEIGADSIRGGWLYRLFHKSDYRYKYFKIINNEKVYLN